ncbi:MAG: hypothetical protein NC225_09975 [Clostridium sp.]|nr:hypothetical protein [Clostridium sp.]MCM1399791.1 hypothetical protein [Clostridium sp.]MCM1459582.1 hypothetical protein [Bacteroides sp.]
MNNKKIIYMISGVIFCILCAVIIRVNIIKNTSGDKSNSTITIDAGIESEDITSDKSSNSTEVDDTSYFANLQENEEKDKEYEAVHGNEVQPYEAFEKGGIKYIFKDVRCIKDVASIPEVIPEYNEKYRIDTGVDGPHMCKPLEDMEKENRLLIICYVFEIENIGNVEVEYNAFGTVSMDVTDENGYIVGGASECFYMNGDEEKLDTPSICKVTLKSGESRELVLGIYTFTMNTWERQNEQTISWDDQLVFYVSVISVGQAASDTNIIQEQEGVRYFELFRGSLNEFSTFSMEQVEI